MSEKLYEVDQFYPGDFAQILTGVYTVKILFSYGLSLFRDRYAYSAGGLFQEPVRNA